MKQKTDKMLKKEDNEKEVVQEVKSPRLIPKRKTSKDLFYDVSPRGRSTSFAETQPEPEPQPDIDKLV
jgi:hypothetical protein